MHIKDYWFSEAPESNVVAYRFDYLAKLSKLSEIGQKQIIKMTKIRNMNKEKLHLYVLIPHVRLNMFDSEV